MGIGGFVTSTDKTELTFKTNYIVFFFLQECGEVGKAEGGERERMIWESMASGLVIVKCLIKWTEASTLEIQRSVNKEHKMGKASKRDKQPAAQLLPPPKKLKRNVQRPNALQGFTTHKICRVKGQAGT